MKKTNIGILLLLAAPVVAFGGKFVTVKDISYYPPEALADAGEYQKTRCKLDLRKPENATNFATVVFFHGGGLVHGNKYFPLSEPSIAQVTVNYRLLQKDGSVAGDDCINDAAAAVAWTLKNIASYGGDPKKVFVSGSSGGGYLTMMVGMDRSRLAKWGYSPNDLAGLVPLSGQATKHFNVRKYAGDNDPQFLPKIDRLAPLNFCAGDLPPILSICGEPPWEWPGRSEENRLLIASCTALGHKSAYFVQVPYCDHGRSYVASLPYLLMFVQGRLPPNLVRPELSAKEERKGN